MAGLFDKESTNVQGVWYPQRMQLKDVMQGAGNAYRMLTGTGRFANLSKKEFKERFPDAKRPPKALRGGIGPYKDPMFVPYSDVTKQGMRQMTRLAENKPFADMSRQGFRNVMNDQGRLNYTKEAQLGGYFDQARKAIDSQFAGSGRYGSGLHKAGLAEEFGQIAQDFANQERDRQAQSQMNADNNRARTLGLAPSLQNAAFQNPENMMKVGQMREAMAGKRLNEDVRQHFLPYEFKQRALGDLKNLASGSYGGYSQTTQGTSPFNVALGVAGAAMGMPGIGGLMGGGGGGSIPLAAQMGGGSYNPGLLGMNQYTNPYGTVNTMPSFSSPMTNYSFGGSSSGSYGW